MEEAIKAFLVIVAFTAPYDIAWSFGRKAYKYVVGALTGKDVDLWLQNI